jgi:protein TonB
MKKFAFLAVLCLTALITMVSPVKTFAQDDYAAVCETPPAPVGGDAAIYKNIDYPDMAKSAKLEGKVYVLVLINSNGGVDDAKLIKGIGLGCDEAAIKAIKKAKFSPGKNGGAAVKAKLTMAINFKLAK